MAGSSRTRSRTSRPLKRARSASGDNELVSAHARGSAAFRHELGGHCREPEGHVGNPSGRRRRPVTTTASGSRDDLKDTGTREISVSRSLRSWVKQVLGRPIQAGEGNLFEVIIDGRLAASPSSVARTPEPVRIWAAGSSGGTHQDVRLVFGSRLKADLDDEAVLVSGAPVLPESIGVFEPPANPKQQPLRLTVFLPSDPAYAAVKSLLGRTGREQKLHFRVPVLPQIPRWP